MVSPGFAVGIIGNFISFFAFLAPVCMMWIFYALVKTNSVMHITINTFGVLIHTVYIIIFLIYAPKKAKKLTGGILIFLNFTVLGIISTMTLLVFHGYERLNILGWICFGISVSCFIAPLSVMRLVIRTKSVEFIMSSFNSSLLQTISAAIWLAYLRCINRR